MTDRLLTTQLIPQASRALRVLLLKPYQHEPNLMVYSPPLGLLSLISSIRERFNSDGIKRVEIRLVDLKVQHLPVEHVETLIAEFNPDVVGLSALNCEAGASRAIAALCKQLNPQIITVLGGPFALHRSEEILNSSQFDWVFDGPADYSFPEALYRLYSGADWGTDIKGFSYRCDNGQLQIATQQDKVQDLDALPRPAWDQIDFDQYAKKTRFGAMAKTDRYALLFTSRGCPYLCNYCHDIFTKKYVYQSVERVISDIEDLYENFGVTEFQIVDDIFNLHKPRLQAIMTEVQRRWPGKLHFSFPNGLRGDILDKKTIQALCEAGTYSATIAIETVTPRLQRLIEKDLNFEKAGWAISEFNRYNVVVAGFFMLGFPTETEQEIEDTINFALHSDLTLANFFTVTPQPKTPLYPLAEQENAQALTRVTRQNESGGGSHRSNSWYQEAHGYPLDKVVRRTIFRFYFSPKRIWRIWRRVPKAVLWNSFKIWWRLSVLGEEKNARLSKEQIEAAEAISLTQLSDGNNA